MMIMRCIMENINEKEEFETIQGLEYVINKSEFLKMISKKIIELYKSSILVNYNKKRVYNKIPGSQEEYKTAVNIFSQKSVELNEFIESFYQQIEMMDFSEVIKNVSDYIETRWNQNIDLKDDNIKKAFHNIIDKFKVNDQYNELYKLNLNSLSAEEKNNLSKLNLDLAAESAVSMGYFGSGYPYNQKTNYQETLAKAESGDLNTINNFISEISNATSSAKNTLNNSEEYSKIDSHHRIT